MVASKASTFWGPVLPMIELELEMLVFMERGLQENPKKNPRSKDENQHQT